MTKLEDLKPTFKLSCSLILDAWNDFFVVKDSQYRLCIRYGQHYCNYFKLSTLNDPEDKKFEQFLWEQDSQEVVHAALQLVMDLNA